MQKSRIKFNNLKLRQVIKLVVQILIMLIWVAASVIVSQLALGLLMTSTMDSDQLKKPVVTAIYSVLSYLVALGWILFATPKLKVFRSFFPKISEKIDRRGLGLRGLPTWTDIGLAPVGFIVSTILAAGLVALFNIFPWFDAKQAQDIGFNTYLIGMDRIIAFLTLVVVAPIAEELVFRGWLYGKMRELLSEHVPDILSMLISIFLVSFLFGLVHMQWNVGVNVFAMSVVLCGLREITGTIYAGILTHMIKNGVAFFLLYVVGIL